MEEERHAVRERLDVYHKQTHPLVDFYSDKANNTAMKFVRVDGRGEVNDVHRRIMAELA